MSAESPVVLYIAGAGRSGSTLVERTLGAEPGAVNVGELRNIFLNGVLRDERCGCGQPFSACGFWTEVGQVAYGGWDEGRANRVLATARDRLRQRFATRHLLAVRGTVRPDPALADYARTYSALYDAVAQVSGRRLVVDASKWPIHAMAVAPQVADLHVLHLVRDPRGTAYSWSKSGVARPDGGPDRPTMATQTPRTAAKLWNRSNAWAALLATTRPAARLGYDDFVRDPGGTLRQAVTALGLPTPALAHVDGLAIDLPASHAIGGNPNRFRAGVQQVVPDETWRSAMPVRDRRTVDLVTLPARAVLAAARPRSAR